MFSSLYQWVRTELYYGVVLRPSLRARHRKLLQAAVRRDSHTYTAFHRSPAQLDALVHPVIDHVRRTNGGRLRILVFAGSNGAEAYTFASQLLHLRPDVEVSLAASDLHQAMVDKAISATYSLGEITQGLDVPKEFIARTFDRDGERYVVKPALRQMTSFEQADLLDPTLLQRFGVADIVAAQNVLFHLPPGLAREVFARVLTHVRPGGVLMLDGMELDMRVELTRAAGLVPMDYRLQEIYEYSRRHIPENWWDLYYGNEPYSRFARHRRHRYGTLFLKP